MNPYEAIHEMEIEEQKEAQRKRKMIANMEDLQAAYKNLSPEFKAEFDQSLSDIGSGTMTDQCGIAQEEDFSPQVVVKTNDAGENVSGSIDDTLTERGNRYGAFSRHAAISQDLQRVVAKYEGYQKFTDAQSEAMNMILHKIARIVNGDPNYDDSWRDIAGYAQLIVDNLNGKDT